MHAASQFSPDRFVNENICLVQQPTRMFLVCFFMYNYCPIEKEKCSKQDIVSHGLVERLFSKLTDQWQQLLFPLHLACLLSNPCYYPKRRSEHLLIYFEKKDTLTEIAIISLKRKVQFPYQYLVESAVDSAARTAALSDKSASVYCS